MSKITAKTKNAWWRMGFQTVRHCVRAAYTIGKKK